MTAGARTIVTALAASLSLLGCVQPSRSTTESTAAAAASNPVRAVEPWTFAGRPGRIIETDRVRIHTTMPDSVLLARFPRFAERALDHYTSALGTLPDPGDRLETYVLASRAQWAALTRTLTGARANVYLRIQNGGYATNGRAVYYDIGPQNTLAIASHEGWHQYTQGVFRQPLPIWLEEGVATYMEGFVWSEPDRNLPEFRPWANAERFEQLRDLVSRDRVIPLGEFVRTRPQDLMGERGEGALDYYAMAWALTHALEGGHLGGPRDALRQMVSDAAEGRLHARVSERFDRRRAAIEINARIGAAVFETYVGRAPEEADAAFRSFLRRMTAPGVRSSITRGVAPPGL